MIDGIVVMIDRLSAVILLESYLDSVRANPEPVE